MKEAELRKCAKCGVCDKKIGHTGLPLFWRVTIERFGLDVNAMRRQDGFAAMLGDNALLAMHMGADEDMATPVMDTITLAVCEHCSTNQVCIAELAERNTA